MFDWVVKPLDSFKANMRLLIVTLQNVLKSGVLSLIMKSDSFYFWFELVVLYSISNISSASSGVSFRFLLTTGGLKGTLNFSPDLQIFKKFNRINAFNAGQAERQTLNTLGRGYPHTVQSFFF